MYELLKLRLKHIDILSKIISLQHSWIRSLYVTSNHTWKETPSYLINIYLGKKIQVSRKFRYRN